MDKTKSIFASKTFWFNLASTIVIAGGVLPPTKTVLTVVTAANVGLRLMTSQPIAEVHDET